MTDGVLSQWEPFFVWMTTRHNEGSLALCENSHGTRGALALPQPLREPAGADFKWQKKAWEADS